jgi:hypothetical protein
MAVACRGVTVQLWGGRRIFNGYSTNYLSLGLAMAGKGLAKRRFSSGNGGDLESKA